VLEDFFFGEADTDDFFSASTTTFSAGKRTYHAARLHTTIMDAATPNIDNK